MENKYLHLIILIIIISSIIGGYYLYKQNSNDEFYNNYEMQNNATYNATKQTNVVLSGVFTSIISSNGTSSNINQSLENAKENISLALNYDQKMLENAKTSKQKEFVKVLTLQTKTIMKYIDLLDKLKNSQKDHTKTKEILSKIDETRNQTINYQTELEKIKNSDSELKKRINEINKKSENN